MWKHINRKKALQQTAAKSNKMTRVFMSNGHNNVYERKKKNTLLISQLQLLFHSQVHSNHQYL